MSECRKCGRDDGHYIGCAAAQPQVIEYDLHNGGLASEDACSFDGCSEPRRSEDKRVKFCAEHSDPKNRK